MAMDSLAWARNGDASVGVVETLFVELGAEVELADLLLQALAHHADRGGGARDVAGVGAQRGEQIAALELDDRFALRFREGALAVAVRLGDDCAGLRRQAQGE